MTDYLKNKMQTDNAVENEQRPVVCLINHQSAVLFSQNKPDNNNQPAVLFSRNKSTPAISHQPNEQSAMPRCMNADMTGTCARRRAPLCVVAKLNHTT
jgi:hypothetical protein